MASFWRGYDGLWLHSFEATSHSKIVTDFWRWFSWYIGDHTAYLNGASNKLVAYKGSNPWTYLHIFYKEENDKRNLQCHPPPRNKAPRPIIKGQIRLYFLGGSLGKGFLDSHEAGFLPTQPAFFPWKLWPGVFSGAKLVVGSVDLPKFWYQKTPKRRHTYHLPYQLKQVVKHQHETPGSFPRSPFLQWKKPGFLSVVIWLYYGG